MAGVATEESGAGRSFEGASSGQLQLQCQSGETSEEWRSLEQVENGIPSTSPAYWYIDDDDDGGQKPFELYGKHTWKIDKFSQITKRELRSNAFEVGGYKWYVLIYPQGCDVCNHLSLFLCVANHDKLLPGWSHLAQFTIAVVNKDPKKSKYSDTLHRFWKKEHDWGWKKFMELPKVFEGFIDADTLIIKAQVQIIRERTDRPFRCLDCPYRRELVRVYLTNVDGLCRRFLEDQRAKLRNLIEDKARWSSFCTFWLGMDQSARQFMSRENAELILKVVVKHFFVEKEVTSTLVMDSLYIGMKALNSQNKGKKSKGKNLEAEPVSIIHIDEDTFVLVDDVLLLLERAAMEPLPPIDEKGPQTRTKDVAAGEEFNKDSIERDERRLAELGRRTIEIFVLAHIFSSKIEVAYQEAVSLMRQEELIREEEAAWLANGEQKTRRRLADKEKKSKKKQGKHKKNNRKVKDKGRDEKLGSDVVLDKTEVDGPTIERDEFSDVETEMPHEKPEVAENISDLSDSIDCEPEILPLDSKGRDASPVNWGTDTSKPHHPIQACSNEISAVSGVVNGVEGISLSALDDSSSTCSSDLVPPVVISVPQRANLRHHHNNQTTSSRGRTRQSACTSKIASQPSEAVPDVGHSTDSSRSSKAVEILPQDGFSTLQDIVINRTKHHVEKDGGTGYMHRVSCSKDVNIGTSVTSPARIPSKSIIPSMAPLNLDAKVNSARDPVLFKNSSTNGPKQIGSSRDVVLSGASGTSVKSPTRIPSKIIPSNAPSKLELNINAAGNPVMVKNSSTNGPKQTDGSNPNENGAASKPETRHVPVTTDKPSLPSLPVVSRPLSAPLGLTSRPAAVSTVSSVGQTTPTLARSVSSTGRLSPEQPTPSYVPQSYHNANMGSHGSSSAYPQIPQNHSANTGLNLSFPFSNALAPVFSPQNVDRMDLIHSNVSYGMVNQTNLLQSGPRIWTEQHFNSYTPMHIRPETHLPSQVLPSSSGHQSNVTGDEFPHLDIINDLLDDDLLIGNEPMLNSGFQNFNNGPQHMNRLFSFPDESGFSRGPVYSTSSCRFEGTRMYHDNGFQNGYGPSTTLYDTVHRASSRPYINGQIDGLVPSQWQRAGLELLYPENDGYSYQHVMEYPNLNVCVNGYSVYRPSNGL